MMNELLDNVMQMIDLAHRVRLRGVEIQLPVQEYIRVQDHLRTHGHLFDGKYLNGGWVLPKELELCGLPVVPTAKSKMRLVVE